TLHSFPTRRSSDLARPLARGRARLLLLNTTEDLETAIALHRSEGFRKTVEEIVAGLPSTSSEKTTARPPRRAGRPRSGSGAAQPPPRRTQSGDRTANTTKPQASAWGFVPAPPAGLEPATLRLTAECSAN